jgi:hypothetical protein
MAEDNRDAVQDQKLDELKNTIEILRAELGKPNRKRSEDEEAISGDRITLWYLLSHIRIAHLWGVIVIMASLISGAGAVTYQFANKKSDAQLLAENAKFEVKLSEQQVELSKLHIQLDNAKKKLQDKNAAYSKLEVQYNEIAAKEHLLAQYLDYMIAYKRCSRQDWAAETSVCRAFASSKKNFATKLKKIWQGSDTNTITANSVIIRKDGGNNKATITFLCDGSKWPVPDKIMELGIFNE